MLCEKDRSIGADLGTGMLKRVIIRYCFGYMYMSMGVGELSLSG